MDISLRDIRESDLAMLEVWAHRIGSDNYMSHYLPKGISSQHIDSNNLFVWYVIVADGKDVGTIWLEMNSLPQNARLGIFLRDVEYFNKGIGEKAIDLAIKQAKLFFPINKVVLNVRENNPRAIACYKKCGFEVIDSGVKVDQLGAEIHYLIMECEVGHHET